MELSKEIFISSYENKKEPKIQKKANIQILKTPNIIIQEEESAQLLSLILKAKFPEWWETDTPLAKMTKKYFENNPLSKEISNFLDNIHALQENGVDEEVLYVLALTYKHTERTKKAFEMIKKNKSYIKNPQELQLKIFKAIEAIKKPFSYSSLSEKINNKALEDKEIRTKDLWEIKTKIEELINFFRPDSITSNIKRVILMPTDPLYKKNSGAAFVFGDELILKSNIENKDNLNHEFLHGIINPIVDKLSRQLTDKQREKISQLANKKLKQDYGEDYYSLLCEELIRTYNDVFSKGERPVTYWDFKQKISGITEEEFQSFLSQSESFKINCKKTNIINIDDFRNKSQEYFKQFIENDLRRLIFECYEEYSNQSNKDDGNFEWFILEKFINKI